MRIFWLILVCVLLSVCVHAQQSSDYTVYFNNNESSETNAQNEDLLRIMRAIPANASIHITGHTDNIGSEAANEALGLLRAQAVRNAFQKAGFTQLDVHSAGEQHPLASNGDANGRQKNRRVEIRVTPAPLVNSSLPPILDSVAVVIDSLLVEDSLVIRGEQGCELHIAPGTFAPYQNEEVTIVLREILTTKDMVAHNMTTVDNTGQQLQSAGMVMVEATVNGRKVKPKRNIKARVPIRKGDRGYKMYRGYKNDDGLWVWEKTKRKPKVSEDGRFYEFNMREDMVMNLDKPCDCGPRRFAYSLFAPFSWSGYWVMKSSYFLDKLYLVNSAINTSQSGAVISPKKGRFGQCVTQNGTKIVAFASKGDQQYVARTSVNNLRHNFLTGKYRLPKKYYRPVGDQPIEQLLGNL